MNAPATPQSDPDLEKIYITAKCRMIAEARHLRNSSRTQWFITWYSFCLIAASLIDSFEIYKLAKFNILSILFSIGVFSASLYWQGEKHINKAASFRQCYLQLKELLSKDVSKQDKLREYARILSYFDNHEDEDYERAVVLNWLRNSPISNANGAIIPSKLMVTSFFLRESFSFFGFLVLLVLPIAVIISLHSQ